MPKGARRFPFRPRTSLGLEIGDYWPVPLDEGRYGCLIVVELKREGVGSRTSLIAGVLDWSGAQPPTAEDLDGCRVLAVGYTAIEVFTEGGSEIVGNIPLPETVAYDSPYRDLHVGAIHRTWGWRSLPRRVAEELANRS